MWDLIVSVPDHCLSFYFTQVNLPLMILVNLVNYGIIVFCACVEEFM